MFMIGFRRIVERIVKSGFGFFDFRTVDAIRFSKCCPFRAHLDDQEVRGNAALQPFRDHGTAASRRPQPHRVLDILLAADQVA